MTNVETRVMNAENLELDADSFDAVICRIALMLFPNPAKALTEMRRVVKPGGKVAVMVMPRWKGILTMGFVYETVRRLGNIPPPAPGEPWMFALGAPGVLEGLYREAGFLNVSVHAAPIPRRFPSAAAAVGNMRKGAGDLKELMTELNEADREGLGQKSRKSLSGLKGRTALRFPVRRSLGSGPSNVRGAESAGVFRRWPLSYGEVREQWQIGEFASPSSSRRNLPGSVHRHGLDIDITYTPGSLYISDALRKGEFEIGHTGADDIVADVEDFGGGPSSLFIFMGLHSGLLSIVGAPGMTTVESLRGKELAVDARASGFVFILEKLLRSNGFGPDDYKFVEIGGVDRRYQALLEGKVAGTICCRRSRATPWRGAATCSRRIKSFPAIREPWAPRSVHGLSRIATCW